MPTEEQIKDQLSECYEEHQPVLLYGEDNIGRLDLVQEIHEKKGGVIYPVEYVASESEPDSKIFINEIVKQLKIAIYGERNKKTTLITGAKMVGNPSLRKKSINIQKLAEIENKVQLHFKSTDKCFREIDCEPCNGGEDVYDYITKNTLLANIPIFKNPSAQVPINESFLFGFKGALFLNNFYKYNSTNNKRDLNCYRLLGGIIKDRKLVNPITNEQVNVAFSWLVIYADVDDPKKVFSPKFRKQFVEIPLDDNGKRHEEGETKVQAKEVSPFPTPQSAKWSDVNITFINDYHVNIKVKEVTKNKVHFSKIGFEYRNTGKEIKLWRTLRTFAFHHGIIPPKMDKQGKLEKIVLPEDVKRLKTKLCYYFGITDKPISYIKGKWIKGNYIKAEGYKTAFHIVDESYLTK
jgi:hypothetical protein